MGFESIIRGAIQGIASPLLESMKIDVTHEAWLGQDRLGSPDFAAPQTLRALIEKSPKQLFTTSGSVVVVKATLIFLDPIADHTANTGYFRHNPIDPRDRITLPDGSTAPIIDPAGFLNSETERPFVNEVLLGESIQS